MNALNAQKTRAQSRLLQRPTDQPIARLTSALTKLPLGHHQSLEITPTQFLNHVHRLAQHIPEHEHAINLCDNRYLFMVSLCAVIIARRTNLLPPNKNASTQSQLGQRYSRCLLIHDGSSDLADELPKFDVSQLDWSLSNESSDNPLIESDHLAAISFTSGSTGEPKPNLKSWYTLVQSSHINAKHMLSDPSINHTHMATVPGQHMWGFETSVLLAMFANVCLIDARPFFPQDIIELIRRFAQPCTLISVPLHLKALSATIKPRDLKPAELASILSATAPLSAELAARLEQQTGAELREVYGCSEVGSMAVRHTANEEAWRPFQGLEFTRCGTKTAVSGEHLPNSVTLEDHVQFDSEGNFTLLGRNSDQIKIAGKRGSLGEVNAVLQRFEGLLDGTVIFPQQNRAVPRLVALVVLAENSSRLKLREHMAKHLDSAFVPRPILEVEGLPREENGKLSKTKVLELYQHLSSK